MVGPEKIELQTKNGEQPTAEDIEYLCDADWRAKIITMIKSGSPLSRLRRTREPDEVYIVQKEG